MKCQTRVFNHAPKCSKFIGLRTRGYRVACLYCKVAPSSIPTSGMEYETFSAHCGCPASHFRRQTVKKTHSVNFYLFSADNVSLCKMLHRHISIQTNWCLATDRGSLWGFCQICPKRLTTLFSTDLTHSHCGVNPTMCKKPHNALLYL